MSKTRKLRQFMKAVGGGIVGVAVSPFVAVTAPAWCGYVGAKWGMSDPEKGFNALGIRFLGREERAEIKAAKATKKAEKAEATMVEKTGEKPKTAKKTASKKDEDEVQVPGEPIGQPA